MIVSGATSCVKVSCQELGPSDCFLHKVIGQSLHGQVFCKALLLLSGQIQGFSFQLNVLAPELYQELLD